MSRTVHSFTAVMMSLFGSIAVLHGQDTTSSVAFSAGMGITAINATDVVDYINAVTIPSSRLDDFSSSAEFFGSAQLRLSDSWGGKLEYAYLINSYNIGNGLGAHVYSYAIHMPTLIVQRVHAEAGYALKFGGGLGYHVALLSERLQGASRRDFTSTGLGIKVDAEGNTALGDRLFAYVGADVRVNVMSTLEDERGNRMQIGRSSSKNATMSFFALGLKLGMTYYF